MDISSNLSNCRVYLAAQSTTDRLPAGKAAVYAFFEALDFSKGNLVDEVDTYMTKHGRYLSMKDDEWPFSVKVRFRGNPTRFKGEGLRLAKAITDIQITNQVNEQLLFLSILGEPLYVGKTEDIKKRFVAHHDNGFLFHMKEHFKRSPNEFVLFVYLCEEERARLLESVLIQTINPPFCDQKS